MKGTKTLHPGWLIIVLLTARKPEQEAKVKTQQLEAVIIFDNIYGEVKSFDSLTINQILCCNVFYSNSHTVSPQQMADILSQVEWGMFHFFSFTLSLTWTLVFSSVWSVNMDGGALTIPSAPSSGENCCA